MRSITKSFLIICLAVSAVLLVQGDSRPVQAAKPCTSNADCQEVAFLNAVGWENGVCTGEAAKPGVCVEAPLKAIPAGPQTGKALLHLVETIVSWVFAGFLVLAVIFIILAALQFLTGGGEPAQVSQARMKLMWAAIAIVIAAAARGIPVAVRAIIGV